MAVSRSRLAVLIIFAITFLIYAITTTKMKSACAHKVTFVSQSKRSVTNPYGSMPIYYINLEGSVDRNRHMQEFLYGKNGIRVEAVNGSRISDIESVFDPQDETFFTKHMAHKLFTQHKTVPGQLGNYLSHLTAIFQAYHNNDEYAIVMEDDLSVGFERLWPIDDIQELIRLANARFNGWRAIRLQWNNDPHKRQIVYEKWRSKILEYKANLSPEKAHELYASWGHWKLDVNQDLPLLEKSQDGWGTMSILWSKEGLAYMYDFYKSVDQPGKIICPGTSVCISDLSFWPHDGILITTPPLHGPRYLSVSTKEIRERVVDGDHTRSHRSSAVSQLAWMMELSEIFSPITVDDYD